MCDCELTNKQDGYVVAVVRPCIRHGIVIGHLPQTSCAFFLVSLKKWQCNNYAMSPEQGDIL